MLDTVEHDGNGADQVVRIMRLLADPTRLRLLSLLRGNEMNVTAICRRLNLAQPTVSHHLGLLRSVGLVINRRQGKQVFYAANPQAVDSYDGREGLSITSGPVHLELRDAVWMDEEPLATAEAHVA